MFLSWYISSEWHTLLYMEAAAVSILVYHFKIFGCDSSSVCGVSNAVLQVDEMWNMMIGFDIGIWAPCISDLTQTGCAKTLSQFFPIIIIASIANLDSDFAGYIDVAASCV